MRNEYFGGKSSLRKQKKMYAYVCIYIKLKCLYANKKFIYTYVYLDTLMNQLTAIGSKWVAENTENVLYSFVQILFHYI